MDEQGQVAGAGQHIVAESSAAPDVDVVAEKKPSGASIDIYETTDGGSRWTRSTIRIAPSLAAAMGGGAMELQFVSSRQGWVLLSSQGLAGTSLNALWGTVDGGRSWRLLQKPQTLLGETPVFVDVTAVTFSQSGWGVASVNSVVLDSAKVLASDNGGRTWDNVQLPLPSAASGSGVAEGAPSLSAQGVVWLPATFQTSSSREELLLYATTDGGRQWTERAWPVSIPLTARVTLSRGQELTLSYGTHLYEYHVAVDSAGDLVWSKISRSAIRTPTPGALSAMG